MATVIESVQGTPASGENDAAPQFNSTSTSSSSVVLHGVSWKLYRALRRTRDNRNTRMTYDQGELEIMSPSAEHEGIATLLGRLIDEWTLELAIPVRSCRTMTIKRAVLERGFEPDNCYYVQHEPQMWNKKKIDFKKDPPPDLAIEVEVHHKLLDKIAIYAAFAVPELWCWRAETLTVLELSTSGEYVPRATSACFPNFPIAKAQEIVRQVGAAHETELVLSFRDWVRENCLPSKTN